MSSKRTKTIHPAHSLPDPCWNPKGDGGQVTLLKILYPSIAAEGGFHPLERMVYQVDGSIKGLDGQVMKAPIQDRDTAKISETHHARNGSEITLEDHYYCQYYSYDQIAITIMSGVLIHHYYYVSHSSHHILVTIFTILLLSPEWLVSWHILPPVHIMKSRPRFARYHRFKIFGGFRAGAAMGLLGDSLRGSKWLLSMWIAQLGAWETR